jgi:hypothetical protein
MPSNALSAEKEFLGSFTSVYSKRQIYEYFLIYYCFLHFSAEKMRIQKKIVSLHRRTVAL